VVQTLVVTGKMIKLQDILRSVLEEEKKKRDRCLRIADRKFDKPSAYKSGAVVRCRRGDIWKNIKEEEYNSPAEQKIDDLPKGKIFDDAKNIESIFNKSQHSWSEVIELFEKNKDKGEEQYVDVKDIHIIQPNIQSNKVKQMMTDLNELPIINVIEFQDGEKVIYDGHHRLVANWALGNPKIKVNLVKVNNLQEDESLHKWFSRQGGKGKEGGWVDCNTCRKDPKTGRKKCKPCGRKEGEKRAKYPSCRPTPSQCSRPGKGKTWGKTK
jgi:hypothetical protein